MNVFNDYNDLYPNLIIEILEYFSLKNGTPNEKSVFKFCDKYAVYDSLSKVKTFIIETHIVAKICNILSKTHLTCLKNDEQFGQNNNYMFIIKDEENWEKNKNVYKNYFNSLVYGNEYIYKTYKDKVLPIVIKNSKGEEAIGTCFKLYSGIVTAKHCLTDAVEVSICGYSSERLQKAKIFISNNYNLDIAYIELNEKSDYTSIDKPKILDDVLVLGYPKVPGFINFLTVEKATISSIAEKSLLQTQGSVVAIEKNIFSKVNLILITAKIRGGNSGGPIINSVGSIVGVACQSPEYEGNYDDLGYGIAIPIDYILEIIDEQNELNGINFYDFEY